MGFMLNLVPTNVFWNSLMFSVSDVSQDIINMKLLRGVQNTHSQIHSKSSLL